MGLDMYLLRRRKDDTTNRTGNEVCYWRKAHQIKQWFEENANYPEGGNLDYVVVSKEKLQDLVRDCTTVLHYNEMCSDGGVEIAEEIIPDEDGNYDDVYFITLRETVAGVSAVIESTDFENYDILYHDWW